MTTQNPLAWNVPIVDAQRRPTKEFMQKWVTQTRINQSIPALSTSAEVSAVLDVLGSSPGSILIRGGSQWEPLASPGDDTKYLDGSGAYSVPAGTTYGVVTTDAAGLAPQLSGVATEFLDGTGNYSAPASGGGDIVKLSSGSVSAAATMPIVFPTLTGYSGVKIVVTQIFPASSPVVLRLRVSNNGGVSYDSASGNYQWANWEWLPSATGVSGGNPDSSIVMNGSNHQGGYGFGEMTIYNPTLTTIQPSFFGNLFYKRTDGLPAGSVIIGDRLNNQLTNAVEFSFSSGNITTGVWELFGIK